ncbi:SWIM-type [Hexamita inflata]|uniref:SWIM-type n=1 Tax=Hexamita inflata TaxID=28002 RepID=A0AA86NM28_9EUKA|nr:SWIM-type [Hexamita inflata]
MKPTKIQQQYLSETRDIKFEMQIKALSCTDSSFKDTLQNHAIHNQGHSESDWLEGCVLKANETVNQYISRSKSHYKVKQLTNRKTKEQYFQIQLIPKTIIPYQYKVSDWTQLIKLSMNLEVMWEHQSEFQEHFQQYYELLEKVRCPCSCRIQSGLPCYHELAIIDHLDSLHNKYLLTSLTREEYSQQWLQDNVFTHFETREFYTLNENNQQYSDHAININQQQKIFRIKIEKK